MSNGEVGNQVREPRVCRRCREPLEERLTEGFPPRYVCVSPGCPKGVLPRLGKTNQPLDMTKEEIRTKIRKLLAMASSAFPEEADTARRLAEVLSEKYGL